ncbi:unnamed protein product, partial [Rotaria sp. Silwood2]
KVGMARSLLFSPVQASKMG